MVQRLAAVAVMAIVLWCDHAMASPSSPVPPQAGKGEMVVEAKRIRPPAIPPVDGRVLGLAHEHGKLTFVIGFRSTNDQGVVKKDWTGVFTADGKEIPGTNFTLTMADQRMARAELDASELPSETVRLFPPADRK